MCVSANPPLSNLTQLTSPTCRIAQLVELFRRLKADHRRLGDQHECLQSDYNTLYAEYEELRAEIVTITRTNAQLRSEIVAVYEGSEMTPPSTPE